MNIKFFRFDGGYKRDAVRIQAKIKYDTLSTIGIDSPLLQYNEFFIKEGKKLFDILQFHDSSNFAISNRVKLLLENNNITGWQCFSIVVENIAENYYAFQPLSKAGPILNLEKVNNFETEYREFDINSWDGSDIFTLEGTLLNVCNVRVKELFQKANVSNLDLRPL